MEKIKLNIPKYDKERKRIKSRSCIGRFENIMSWMWKKIRRKGSK